MAKRPAKKRFAVSAKVRVVMPGVNGIVTQADDKPTVLAEYWHTVKTEHGARKEPGSNLELIPTPIGGEAAPTDNTMQGRLVEYFRSLETALDVHKQKGTVSGDAVYQRIYDTLCSDLATIGVGKDQIETLAAQCGHGSTLARLEKLRKKPIGFSGEK